MTAPEINDEDRALIERYISLLYAEAFVKKDYEQTTNSISKALIDLFRKIGESELLKVRRQMQDRGITVKNTAKGVFHCLVRGYMMTSVWDADMARMKAEKVLEEIAKQ